MVTRRNRYKADADGGGRQGDLSESESDGGKAYFAKKIDRTKYNFGNIPKFKTMLNGMPGQIPSFITKKKRENKPWKNLANRYKDSQRVSLDPIDENVESTFSGKV